jgi:hypothetical protein
VRFCFSCHKPDATAALFRKLTLDTVIYSLLTDRTPSDELGRLFTSTAREIATIKGSAARATAPHLARLKAEQARCVALEQLRAESREAFNASARRLFGMDLHGDLGKASEMVAFAVGWPLLQSARPGINKEIADRRSGVVLNHLLDALRSVLRVTLPAGGPNAAPAPRDRVLLHADGRDGAGRLDAGAVVAAAKRLRQRALANSRKAAEAATELARQRKVHGRAGAEGRGPASGLGCRCPARRCPGADSDRQAHQPHPAAAGPEALGPRQIALPQAALALTATERYTSSAWPCCALSCAARARAGRRGRRLRGGGAGRRDGRADGAAACGGARRGGGQGAAGGRWERWWWWWWWCCGGGGCGGRPRRWWQRRWRRRR